jgi:DNA mismatch repair ATPase MutS
MMNSLDEQTRAAVLPRHSFEALVSELASGQMVGKLSDILTTPLTDIDMIHDRLDAVEDLYDKIKSSDVKDFDSPAEQWHRVMRAYSVDYGPIAKVISEFRSAKESRYFQRRPTEELRNMVLAIADLYNDLPADLGMGECKNQSLVRLNADYSRQQSEDGTLHEFVELVKGWKNKIEEIEAPVREEHYKKHDHNRYAPPAPKISYEQLDGIITQDLEKYESMFAEMNSFAQELGIYLLLAHSAVKNNYVKPEVVPKEENCLIIKQGKWEHLYHPVPNDVNLSGGNCVEIIEGPNNAGKTVDMKMAIQVAALALAGSWVPAEYAKVSMRDRIILREKGTGNAISAFQQDCRSTIECTPPPDEYWLIGMDETFTSTEKLGGRALTWGYSRAIQEQGKSLLMISSHYRGLSDDLRDGVAFCHFTFERTPEGICFPHKKKDGPLTAYRYAVEVAQSKNFDPLVLQYAAERLAMTNPQG